MVARRGRPEERVRAALTGVASVYARHGRLLGVAVEVSTYDAEIGAVWRALVERFIDETVEHLARERAAGGCPRSTRGPPPSRSSGWPSGPAGCTGATASARSSRWWTSLAIWMAALYPRSFVDEPIPRSSITG